MGGVRDACSILAGKPEGKRPLGIHRHRCENNIKIYLKNIYRTETESSPRNVVPKNITTMNNAPKFHNFYKYTNVTNF
jgi:hypothetical protein